MPPRAFVWSRYAVPAALTGGVAAVGLVLGTEVLASGKVDGVSTWAIVSVLLAVVGLVASGVTAAGAARRSEIEERAAVEVGLGRSSAEADFDHALFVAELDDYIENLSRGEHPDPTGLEHRARRLYLELRLLGRYDDAAHLVELLTEIRRGDFPSATDRQ